MKKTVLIDLTSLDDNFSGIEHYALYITKELIKSPDFDFELLFKNSVSRFEPAELENVKTTVLTGNRYEILLKKIPDYIDKAKPDYAIFLAFPPSLLWKPNEGTKVISTIHDLVAFDAPKTMTLKSRVYFRRSILHAIKISGRIITISDFSRSRIVDRLKFDSNRMIMSYCSSSMPIVEKNEEEMRAKYSLPEHYLLGLSTLEPRKNFRTLIGWLSRIWNEDPGVPDLVLVGRKGWKVEKLLEGVPEKLKGKIHFTGFVDDEDIYSIYKCADTFIFPSIYEGFGIPILEAVQAGKLPLCSDIPTSREILGEEYPFLFRLDSFDDFKEKLYQNLDCHDSPDSVLKNDVSKYDWMASASAIIEALMNESHA